MINKLRKTLVIGSVFLIGAVTGGLVGSQLVNDDAETLTYFFTNGWMLNSAIETGGYVQVLRDLREGDIANGIDSLEQKLDSRIIGLKVAEEHTDETNRAVIGGLEAAKEYRLKYPRRTNNQMMDERVSKVLESLEE